MLSKHRLLSGRCISPRSRILVRHIQKTGAGGWDFDVSTIIAFTMSQPQLPYRPVHGVSPQGSISSSKSNTIPASSRSSTTNSNKARLGFPPDPSTDRYVSRYFFSGASVPSWRFTKRPRSSRVHPRAVFAASMAVRRAWRLALCRSAFFKANSSLVTVLPRIFLVTNCFFWPFAIRPSGVLQRPEASR